MAKRLRLIPQHEWESYMRYKSEKRGEPESENTKLLKNPHLPPDIKLSLYSQNTKRKIPVARRMESSKVDKEQDDLGLHDTELEVKIPRHQLVAMQTKHFQTDPTPAVNHLTSEEIEKFIESANLVVNSRGYQNAVSFLTMLKNYPSLVKWNTDGELSYRQGEYIPGTSIKVIVEQLFRNLKYHEEPLTLHRMFAVMKFLKISPIIILNQYHYMLYSMMYKDPAVNPTMLNLNTTVGANVSTSSSTSDSAATMNRSFAKFEAMNPNDNID